jgi:non-reducing end alpha-L-arabinofuranosidase
VTSPAHAAAGFLSARASWSGGADTLQQRVRNAPPVKINELRFASGGNATDQFIELYNAAPVAVDISNWKLVNTQTFFAPVPLATIPAGTRLAPRSHYLLGLASSGLAAPATAGATVLNVRSVGSFAAGQPIRIGDESHRVKAVGTAATVPTTIFIPVSTGPWLQVPAGSTSLPVANAAGFVVGEKMGIDAGGRHEIVTVTAVGKPATQTTLSTAVKAGESSIRVANAGNITAGDTLTVGTGARLDIVKVASVGSATGDGAPVTLTAPLKFDNMQGVDVAGPGTGIRFTPATRFAHTSGDAVQALGSGITLDRPLARARSHNTPIVNSAVTSDGYQGPAPQQWFGGNLSIRGGAISLTDPTGKVLADAIVYGSQQSNSSASGAITSPDIAVLEGVQHQGGCIAVVPGAGSGPSAAATALAASAPNAPNRSIGRIPDGADSDSLCHDFVVQAATTLPQGAAAGATNLKVAGVAGFAVGQSITIGVKGSQETVTIAAIGTPGAAVTNTAIEAGTTVIPVSSAAGFTSGQAITVGSGANAQGAVVASTQGGRGGARITVAQPLDRGLAAGTPVAGSGLTLTAPLMRAHAGGVPVTAEAPTPGTANRYVRTVQ